MRRLLHQPHKLKSITGDEVPTYTIGGVTFESLGVLSATLTYRVGTYDTLDITTNAKSGGMIAGSGLGTYVDLYRSGSGNRLFKGRIYSVKRNMSADFDGYTFRLVGPLYDLDQTSVVSGRTFYDTSGNTSSGNVAEFFTSTSLASNISSAIGSRDSGLLTGTVTVSSSSLRSEKLSAQTSGDLLRRSLGYIGDYFSRINYDTMRFDVRDLAYGSYGTRTLADVISLDVGRTFTSCGYAEHVYVADYISTVPASTNFRGYSSSASTRYSGQYLALRDSAASADSLGVISTISSIPNASLERRYWNYYNYYPVSINSVFANSTNGYAYSRCSDLSVYINAGPVVVNTFCGGYVSSQASTSVIEYYGPAPSGGQTWYLCQGGVPYESMTRAGNPNAPYYARIRGKLRLQLIAYGGVVQDTQYAECDVLCQTNPNGVSNFYNVFSGIEANNGTASQMLAKQRALVNEGLIVAPITYGPPWNDFDRVTYGGTTYRGIKEMRYDLSSERVTFAFSGASDGASVDGVRTLRDYGTKEFTA